MTDECGPWDCLSDWPPPVPDVAYLVRRYGWTSQEIGTFPIEMLKILLHIVGDEN